MQGSRHHKAVSSGPPSDAGNAGEVRVPRNHPVSTLMEEHKVILGKLDELAGLIDALRKTDSLDDFGRELDALKDVAHHLVEAESHHRREEEALFPFMEAHGVRGPTNVMRMDHVELRKRKHELHEVAASAESLDFGELKSRAVSAGEYIMLQLRAHISKEDNILYRMALQILSEEEWEEVKKKSDEIGYCCFTPKD